MSITVVKDKGATVVTVVSDRKSVLPPLCQILRSLCYSPVCCSVHKGLMQPDVVSALGVRETELYLFICSVKWWSQGVELFQCETTVLNLLQAIQLMVGLFNIGLGPGYTSQYDKDFAELGAAYWLGGVVNIIVVSILA